MAKRRRKNRTHVATADDATTPPPRSFVVKSGDVGKLVAHLVRDVRRVMHPNTAAKLRERKSNKLRDYVALAGPLHVSHLAVFSRGKPKPENPALGGALNLRIGKLPRGPTAGFRVNSYSLASDVVALQKTPKTQSGSLFASAPLLVLNNFPTDRNEYKLLATLLQNMFPAISVADMKISSTRRVVLFNYNAETDALDFRHYAIDVKATGVSKGVKKIVSGKGVPDLGAFRDISDYITREAVAAESDLEDGPENTVELPHNYTGRNNRQAEQRAIKLTELGPRMDLSLMKIQEGLCSGEVLFHRFVQKTPAELKALQTAKAKREADKARRRAEQEANVDRKKQVKEEKRAKKAAKKATKEEEDDGTDIEYGDGHEDSDDEGRPKAFEQTMISTMRKTLMMATTMSRMARTTRLRPRTRTTCRVATTSRTRTTTRTTTTISRSRHRSAPRTRMPRRRRWQQGHPVRVVAVVGPVRVVVAVGPARAVAVVVAQELVVVVAARVLEVAVVGALAAVGAEEVVADVDASKWYGGRDGMCIPLDSIVLSASFMANPGQQLVNAL
ncbi:hypothetical protein AMAG_09935 [Allomyces macrogynus ATCC 38327]|uniref:Brix domain-containing protein n=1 Tax=Allomyces macrogynus (strain ATCC 38327) TaxID=578462 RepID=A0A0L0SPZ4_ALLM3|nr:hypothetical protein AMAG_09935 [Allomyces macrogynus ATCC 38327]|eukprot:KNE64576.1 hypothetical protein AMAG_09935 [Allomyces macrogynus ATCC 38327]